MGEQEKGNDTQQMAVAGIKPEATAARMQPLYMGRLLW